MFKKLKIKHASQDKKNMYINQVKKWCFLGDLKARILLGIAIEGFKNKRFEGNHLEKLFIIH